MKFAYKAKSKEGQLQEGAVEASSREAAIDILQRNKLVILKLTAEEEAPIFTRNIRFFERVKKKDIVIFSRQLSILFSAKVPLTESLQVLTSQTANLAFQQIIIDIAKETEGGMSISQAMSKHPKAFSDFYVNMVKSGEVSGKLEEVFNYLADSLEREYNLSARVFNSLIYPAIIFIVFIAIIIAMFVFVVPKLKDFVVASGQELPLPTRMIFAVSDFILNYWMWLLPLIVFGGILGARFFWYTKEGRLLWDEFKLKVPIFGLLFQKLALARFADSLSTLIAGGIPIIQAIEVTSDVVGNEYYRSVFLKSAEQVKKGFSMSSTLKIYPEIIPAMVSQMIFVAEETGRLEEIFKKIASFYAQETTRTLDALASLIEPVMIIILGVFVFILVLAILMPIYSITQSL